MKSKIRILSLAVTVISSLSANATILGDTTSLLHSKSVTQEPVKPIVDPTTPIGPLKPLTPDSPLVAKIDDEIGVTNDNVVPGSIKSNYSVGTSSNQLKVVNGVALFNVDIKSPYGGKLQPQISISYSSQAGNGLVGYGFSISGISAITRGTKDLFHDKTLAGVKYAAGDSYFLNGTRLILEKGTAGSNGAVYSPEGDPFTKVTVHGSGEQIWFEVAKSGITYRYGENTTSRVTFSDKNNVQHIAAWYISSEENQYSDFITYNYTQSNYCIRPTSIIYGINKKRGRGLYNQIAFAYQNISTNVQLFPIGDKAGKMDAILKEITTSTNSQTYRKYTFVYDNTSDKSRTKYYRLKKIIERNGNGESLPPINLNWNYLEAASNISKKIDVKTKDGRSYVEEGDKQFFAADLTGDGVSDIIRVSPVKYPTVNKHGQSVKASETWVYISRSEVSNTGIVSYKEPIVYQIPASFSMDGLKSAIGGTSVMDFDGDGYNDLIFPYHNEAEGHWNNVDFYIIKGKDVANNQIRCIYWGQPLKATHDTPLFLTFDVDGDGKDEIVNVEQKQKNGVYNGVITKSSDGTKLDYAYLNLKLIKDPKKIFCADFNSDGLTDIILLYDGGYKIYFNNGGTATNGKFTEQNAAAGTNFGDTWRISQGDFDGDGRMDFVFVNGSGLDWALNNGDGTFTIKKEVAKLDFSDQSTNKDNDKYALLAYDMDGDGKSDVFVSKAVYVHHGGIDGRNSFKRTNIVWLNSDGSKLIPIHNYETSRSEDALERTIFLGNFTGDGSIKLANYGGNLNGVNTSTSDYERIQFYGLLSSRPEIGKIASVTDGLGNSSNIYYESSSNPTVYINEHKGVYPANSYTLSSPLVSKVVRSNGAAASQTTTYSYKNHLVHIAGRGDLGFESSTENNITLGSSSTNSVVEWNKSFWLPSKSKLTNTVGNNTSETITETSLGHTSVNYFAYNSHSNIKDLDGNTAETIYKYDTSKGVPLEQTVNNGDGNMYKKVIYSDYVQKSGVWMPQTMERIQKHSDDNSAFSIVTKFTYDEKGNLKNKIERSNTSLPLTTEYQYDDYGNVTSMLVSGNGVKPNRKQNTYDNTGRFVIASSESGSTTKNSFELDIWGNQIKATDETDSSNPLITTYTYDGWGDKQEETAPDGTITEYSKGWGSSNAKKFYIRIKPASSAATVTWYDNRGREVSSETTGPKGVKITSTTAYNGKGLVASKTSTTGKLSINESFTYDERGRVLADNSTSGSHVSYSYGNRSVSETHAGRTTTKKSDAWGNTISVVSPNSSETVYSYRSNGKPSRIATNGSVLTFEYDNAGNQVALIDPDAGRSTYSYAADGKMLTETNGKGVVTTNTYDDAGRLIKSVIGNKTIQNFYGTSGIENQRLIRSVLGNNSITYSHDKYGRVTTEQRNVEGKGTYTFKYAYNSKGQLAKTSYPDGLEVSYSYDDNGFKTQSKANGNIIYNVESYDGLTTKSSFLGSLYSTQSLDSRGFEKNVNISKGDIILDDFNEEYDGLTGDMLSRQRNNEEKESFEYDDLDRLILAKRGSAEAMKIEYADNGNIKFKTGIGNYNYNENIQPHAVKSVDNADKMMSSAALGTNFNDLNRIDYISNKSNDAEMSFIYGPDLERWYTSLKENVKDKRTTVYCGDYEQITENGITHDFYYLDGNTIIVRDNSGKFTEYVGFTDNLGSIMAVYDKNGDKVFDAYYDAWGKQTVKKNTIGLHRGYCGHEMLNEFDLINMNGRLYDPLLGRFLSPDNFVQLPDNNQNFNRYSYCLNNPLKYTDPSGELFGLDDALVFGIFSGAIMGAMNAEMSGSNAWKGALIGAAGAAATYGIGQWFGTATNVFSWHELGRAGMHGLASGVFNALNGDNFFSSFASGFGSSFIGSFAQSSKWNAWKLVPATTAMGGTLAWATGGSFLNGAFNGLQIGSLNFSEHDNDNDGIRYYHDSNNNLHGEIKEVVVYPRNIIKSHITTAEAFGSVGTALKVAEGVNKYQSKIRIGTNGKVYLPKANGQFYGNQYVRTRLLKEVKGLKFFSNIYTFSEDYVRLQAALLSDGGNWGVNCKRYVAHIIGREIGSGIGSWGGRFAGALGGSGIGSVPLSIAGSVAGDYVGGALGGQLGEFFFDSFVK